MSTRTWGEVDDGLMTGTPASIETFCATAMTSELAIGPTTQLALLPSMTLVAATWAFLSSVPESAANVVILKLIPAALAAALIWSRPRNAAFRFGPPKSFSAPVSGTRTPILSSDGTACALFWPPSAPAAKTPIPSAPVARTARPT
jgi:hypothetical protein